MKRPKRGHSPTGGAARERHFRAYLSGGFGLSFSSMLGLLIPLKADHLGAPVATIGLIIAARAVAEIVVSVPVGATISRFGARATFIAGTAASTGVAVAFAMAQDYWTLLVLSALSGVFRSLAWVASQALASALGSTPQDRARNTGRFSFVGNAGQMVAPVIAGAAATVLGFDWSFLSVAAFSLLFVLVGLALPRYRTHAASASVRLRDAGALLRIRRIRIGVTLSFVRLWVPSIWTPFFPLFLVADGFSPSLAGVVVSSAAVVATAVNLMIGYLSKWASPDVLCLIGLGSAVLGLLLSPVLMSVPVVFVPAALVGIGNGLSLPLLIVLFSEAAPAHLRGVALGVRAGANSAASAVAPLAVAPLVAALGITMGFVLTGGFAGALLLFAYALHVRRKPAAVAVT